MRIHWSITILASIGVILLTWHYRTKDLDFMTPNNTPLPPEDFGDDLAAGVSILQPKLEEVPDIHQPLEVNPIEPEPEVRPITDTELGDLESAPGLDAYRDFAQNNPAERLLELSSVLRTMGQFQRSLIALERVIDSAEAFPAELQEAGQGIGALEPTLTPWNIDSEGAFALNFNVGTAGDASPELKAAALEIATLIKRHSGNLIDLSPKISRGESEEVVVGSPITLWISTTTEPIQSTPVLSVKPPEDPAQLTEKLTLSTFHAIRNQLEKDGFPLPLPLDEAPKTLLTTQITRLMWRHFADSLLTVPPLPDDIEPADIEVETPQED